MEGVLARERVLVVDGDRACRALLAQTLARHGFDAEEATTGEEALRSARGSRPALVVLEVTLPGKSGYEVCCELRHRFGEDLPIVFVSGARTESYDRDAGLLFGANDYIFKPFVADELLACVRRLIDGSDSRTRTKGGLTRRELEVLRLLASGLHQATIARELGICQSTVAKHIEHILKKLGSHSRAQAVASAYTDNLIA